jgi:hypothetical protein
VNKLGELCVGYLTEASQTLYETGVIDYTCFDLSIIDNLNEQMFYKINRKLYEMYCYTYYNEHY